MMKPVPLNRAEESIDDHLFLHQGSLKGEQMVPEVPKSDAAALDTPSDTMKWKEART